MSIKAVMRKVGTPEQQNILAAAAQGKPTPASQQVVDVPNSTIDDQLGLGAEEPAPVKATPAAATPATVGGGSLGVAAPNRYSEATGGALQGDWDATDFKYPQLKVVQGSGPLTQEFNIGTVILGDATVLPPPDPKAEPTPVRVIPISLRKRYQENVSEEDFKAGRMGETVDTIHEVEARGGTTQWIGGQKPSWSATAIITLLVEAPKGLEHPNFSLPLDGKDYAIAVYYAKSSGYAGVAKAMFNALPLLNEEVGKTADGRPIKRPYLSKKVWTISWKRKEVNGFSIIAPTARLTTDITGPEAREFIQTLNVPAASAE